MRLQAEVLVFRGGIAKSRHRVQCAVVTPAGELNAVTDDARRVTSFRSAAKPFQLLPLVERGHADRWRWSDEELAVMCASHTGSPYHLALVSRILDRLGLSDRHLACGYHDPQDPESLDDVRKDPVRKGQLYNNCSGKHAGMLALAQAEGRSITAEQLARRAVETAAEFDDATGLPVDSQNIPLQAARTPAR